MQNLRFFFNSRFFSLEKDSFFERGKVFRNRKKDRVSSAQKNSFLFSI